MTVKNAAVRQNWNEYIRDICGCTLKEETMQSINNNGNENNH